LNTYRSAGRELQNVEARESVPFGTGMGAMKLLLNRITDAAQKIIYKVTHSIHLPSCYCQTGNERHSFHS
jgi:hypothetical protein